MKKLFKNISYFSIYHAILSTFCFFSLLKSYMVLWLTINNLYKTGYSLAQTRIWQRRV